MARAPGDVLNISVIAPRSRDVRLTAVAEERTNLPYLAARQALYILCVLFAASLLLFRPSAPTWGLFLYSLSAITPAETVLSGALRDTGIFILWAILATALVMASTFGLTFFVVTSAHRSLQGPDKAFAAAAAALALAAGVINFGQPPGLGLWTYGQTAAAFSSITLASYLIAAIAIFATHRSSRIRSRARLEWIAVGVITSGLAIATKELISTTHLTYAQQSILNMVPVALFATAAYALLRERIVDVTFVVSRALVYAMLTSIVVGVLALIDWFVSKRLEQVQLGFILEVCTALALGFAFQRIHRWSDMMVDRYVFRSAHEAETTLRRLGNALAHAPSWEVIDRVVSKDAAQVLSLASAAVFHADGESGFSRTAACGWPEGSLRYINRGHRLALYLSTEERPIVSHGAFDEEDRLPQSHAAPGIAIPCTVRHRLIGFVLYGTHISGAQPDKKDVELLRELVEHATAAFDHVAVVERTTENRELRKEVELLRSLLAGDSGAGRSTTLRP
ncbi:MAG TPA: hypothetical protein VJP85_02185 [Candidatus Baltobacteraceae bacterium]|nr:hypothetical protein [Candidatus Baltobacteraceae bacterium]